MTSFNAQINDSAIIELQVFGPVHAWLRMADFQTVYIEQHENYNKGSYRNRYYIGSSHGKQLLSIPLLKGKNEQMPIRSVQISKGDDWQKNHLQTIKSCYGNAPFYDHYIGKVETLIQNPTSNLFDYSFEIFTWCAELLQLETNFLLTEFYGQNQSEHTDLRNTFKPQKLNDITIPPYPQVFEDRVGFQANLSILDLIFCTGPEAVSYVTQQNPSGDT